MVRRTVLDNGLRLLSEEIVGMPTVSVGIWVEHGSRDEDAQENGISHFLEHLFFKGTPSRTAEHIAKEIDAIGGVLDAFTGKEYTCYYARVLADQLPLALDLLTDVFLHSCFPEDEIERERFVICQEIAQTEDQPEELIGDLFHQDFWPDHPLSWPITGTVDSVSRLTRNHFLAHQQRYYCPDRVFVAMAGGASHRAFVDAAGPAFSTLTGTAKVRPTPPPVAHPGVSVHQRDLEQTYASLGIPCVSQTSPDWYAAYLLQTTLGGGLSSRLFQEIREHRGLVYDISSFLSACHDAGYLGVYFATNPDWVPEVLQVTCRTFRDMARYGISAEELKRAKGHTRGSLLLDLETSEAWMNRLARCEIYFRRDIPVAEVLEEVDRVSLDQVHALAAEYFTLDKLTLTLLGHAPPVSDYQTLIAL